MVSITKKKPLSGKINRVGWLFILPALAIFIVYLVYPLLQAIMLSFQTKEGIGLLNYERLLKDKTFHTAIKNTLWVVCVDLFLMLPLALVMAAVLHQKGIKFKGFWRTLLFVPCIMAAVTYSTIFKVLFGQNGLINTVFTSVGIFNAPYNFLADTSGARLVLAIAIIWRWSGYNMVLYCTGFSSIDETIYEAAALDGATGLKSFIHITIPLLKPIILLTVITSTNGSLQTLDEVWMLTNGGPANSTITISLYLYNTAFGQLSNFAYASAMGVVLMIAIAILTGIQKKAGDKYD